MNRYRVTVPPFEVDAESPEEAESIVDIALDEGVFDYEIEDITDGGIIRLRYTGDFGTAYPDRAYELDLNHTIHDKYGWTSTRWRSAGNDGWITESGHWPSDQAEIVRAKKETS